MFSQFDVQISSEELHTHEPTQADVAEYHAWLEQQERDASRRRLMDHMDGLQQDQGHCLDFGPN